MKRILPLLLSAALFVAKHTGVRHTFVMQGSADILKKESGPETTFHPLPCFLSSPERGTICRKIN